MYECYHCGKAIAWAWILKIVYQDKIKFIYICPECKEVHYGEKS